MSNTWFAFKQFTIRQDRTAMKVSTDGVLLGAWTSVDGNTSDILDIGTGTGLIAIMMAQRTGAVIDALEIEPGALGQATENVKLCPWESRINVIGKSFSAYASEPGKKYDLLTCNPPWFSNCLPSADENRKLARHVEDLGLESLVKGSELLLGEKGRLSVIVPAEEAEKLIFLARDKGLYCTRECGVIYKKGRPLTRMLMEFSRLSRPREKSSLLIEDKGFTEDYKNLTRGFYLKF